jgi:hypothetical protein
MERTHIITKEDGHQKSTKQAGKGGDTVAGIIKKGDTVAGIIKKGETR